MKYTCTHRLSLSGFCIGSCDLSVPGEQLEFGIQAARKQGKKGLCSLLAANTSVGDGMTYEMTQ